MQKLLLLSILLCWSGLAVAQKKSGKKSAAPAPSVYELSDALAQKLVEVKVQGTGGHQGPCLKLICTNLKGKFFRLRIPQGMFMDPADSSYQTLVTAEDQTLAVRTGLPAEVLLHTFCAQSGDYSPLAGSAFAVGVLAPERLRNLLKFIVEKGKTDQPEAQNAVWCVTSGGSLGSIGDPELTRFTAELLGKTVPGYRVKHRTVQVVPGERAAPGKAFVVEGNYSYSLEKDEKLVMNLLDASKKLVKQVSKEELMKAGEHRSSFHLEVWNLPPGQYTVRIQTRDGRVIKDIEVEF